MRPNNSAVKDRGYAPASRQQNHPTFPPPPALCRQKTGNHFFNKRFAPASPLPLHPSKGKGRKKPWANGDRTPKGFKNALMEPLDS